jgi:hypothetical protein
MKSDSDCIFPTAAASRCRREEIDMISWKSISFFSWSQKYIQYRLKAGFPQQRQLKFLKFLSLSLAFHQDSLVPSSLEKNEARIN